ncbi:TlpA disulfide reductase family protein [uncultured Nitratireductor sp.]|uniref:thiol:disulfide interchange protein TlpA n=1 Tax=uncultured Nitratireductor sp. TaxID=520953 RepID=UPI0025F44AC2|nr:TlpA disulfide reductase family protein [uncultured Nitratireductor sp.]
MSKQKQKFPALRLVFLAVAAGAVAGAIAVYVKGGLDGNMAATPIAAEAEDAACTAKQAQAKAVGDAATGHVAAMLAADPPRSLNALTFAGPEGEAMSIADFAGRTVLMNLWATWCTPCREEMPALDALQAAKGSDDFEVVAVNVDRGGDEKPTAFLEETGIQSLGYYRDNSMKIFNDLKSQGLALGLPVTLLIDEEGCLLAHMNGPAEWASPDAERLVDAAHSTGK